MRIITKYKVADKEFANKQDALEYEEKLRNNLYERALHLVAYFWRSYDYPSHPDAINLINHFCENKKIPTEKGGERQIGELLLVGTGAVEKWLKNNPMETLTEREQLILDANKSFRRVFRYDSGKKLSIDHIHWEIDEMKFANIMNENLNLVEILKDCPKGTKLYSPMVGEVEFDDICEDSVYPINTLYGEDKGSFLNFTKEGLFNVSAPNGECMLFPSKENRDWSKFYKWEI